MKLRNKALIVLTVLAISLMAVAPTFAQATAEPPAVTDFSDQATALLTNPYIYPIIVLMAAVGLLTGLLRAVVRRR